jgi:serine/threonine-protein phosphatase 2A regulatory subunit B''
VDICSWATTFADTQFYFPDGPPASREMASQCLARIDQIFAGHPDGLPASGLFTVWTLPPVEADCSLLLLMGWMDLAYFMPCHVCFSILTVVLRGGGLWIAAFMTITKEICKLPSFFSGILFKNIDVNGTGLVKR